MAEHDLEASPRVYARIGGVLYLIIIVLGLFAEAGVRDKLVVSNDATATARNIIASPLLWRSGIAGELFMLTCAVALALIFYVLLRPVSKHLALLAASFNLVSIAIEARRADPGLHRRSVVLRVAPLEGRGRPEVGSASSAALA